MREMEAERFLDSSVFLHAYLVPRRRLSPREKAVKEAAKAIIVRVDSGSERVFTTIVHVAEVANIIESRLGLQASLRVVARLFSLGNVRIVGVSEEDYEEAIGIAGKYMVSINDALAYVKMLQHGVREIYTFDKHFKNLPGVIIVQG